MAKYSGPNGRKEGQRPPRGTPKRYSYLGQFLRTVPELEYLEECSRPKTISLIIFKPRKNTKLLVSLSKRKKGKKNRA